MKILEITLLSISFAGLIGTGTILIRKVPVLVKLSEKGFPGKSLVSRVKKISLKIPGAERFDYELYLQKMLSKVRVLTLKTESKTGSWLERLRQKRNGHNHDNSYWEELKKAKEGK